MTQGNLEVFMAKLYTNKTFRQNFLNKPFDVALESGLSIEQASSLQKIDRDGLIMAANSFYKKREGYKLRKKKFSKKLGTAIHRLKRVFFKTI